jgi:hypothetical protein
VLRTQTASCPPFMTIDVGPTTLPAPVKPTAMLLCPSGWPGLPPRVPENGSAGLSLGDYCQLTPSTYTFPV